MKAKESKFIKENKALFKELLEKLLMKHEYASILVTDSKSKTYSVSKTGISIQESGLHTKRGYVVKVYHNGAYAEYSGNKISEEEIENVLLTIEKELLTILKDAEGSKYPCPKDEIVSFSKSTDLEVDPDELSDEEIINKLSKIFERGMAYDEKVLNCSVNTSTESYSKLFLSKNKDLEQNIVWTTGFIAVNSKRGEEVKQYFKTCSVLGGMELLDEMEGMVDNVAKSAIELLDASPIEPGEYDCICTPETTGMIVHEAFGHGVEMDMFVKDRALAKQYIGEYVASPLVTMRDGNAVNDTATYFFDDEGTLSNDTLIIDKGILVAGMSDLQSALHLGTEPTGNGRRESFERKAYTRMTNTYFEPGTDKLEDMMASIKYGFLLDNPSSGMEDPKNWGIQCMVTVAKEIKDGKLTGKIFSPIILTGYVPDLLKSISMVSDSKEINGSGHCGKGYKEFVKVSDGGPYIKAKVRLG